MKRMEINNILFQLGCFLLKSKTKAAKYLDILLKKSEYLMK